MDFYQEFRKLALGKPHNAITSRASENCAFGDYFFRSKNIYLSYFLTESEDCYYSEHLVKCRDCVDCLYLCSSELCYECVDCSMLYNCEFMQDCHNCSNSAFCLDCLNCKDCFGSFGLRNQRFCIFNKNYPEEVYREKISQLRKHSPLKILDIMAGEFNRHPRLYARLLKGGENCYGDYIYYSKNCYWCFNVRNTESCLYVSELLHPEIVSRDCVDCDLGSALELCYEGFNLHLCTNCNFAEHCAGCSDSEYIMFCYNCRNCFGCAYLMNKEYCILNRQFTREEYMAAVSKIKQDLKATGTYGKSLAEILR